MMQLSRMPGDDPAALIWALAATTAGFAVVATDVFWPSSLHLLQPLDQWTHELVVANLTPEFRADVADKVSAAVDDCQLRFAKSLHQS